MHYDIVGLGQIGDGGPGSYGFMIRLKPEFKTLVQLSGITEVKAAGAVATMHRQWLDACGYDARRLPVTVKDEQVFGDAPRQVARHKAPADAEPVYGRFAIRLSWGEWGPEHITVPGSACGLDLDTHALSRPLGGACLLPHNVDSWRQAQLLLVIFTWFVSTMTVLTDDGRRKAD